MDRAALDQMRAIEEDHWWFSARRRILSGQIEAMRLPAGARILEVGCGAGGNLPMLARFGQVTAVEPDGESRRHAQARGVATVLAGGFPDLPGEGGFDLAAALDVIEHIEDDAGAVAILAGRLKPGGRLIATVPAYAWLWSAHDELHHHKRRYTLGGFRRLFETAGLKVRKASYFNSVLFPAVAAARLVQGATGRSGRDDDMPSPVVNGVLRRLFAAEAPFLRHGSLPFGVSILLIAERD